MSTTLVPPSYYVVKPPGQPAHTYRTVAEMAAAMYWFGRTRVAVGAVMGTQHRRFTDSELRELRRELRGRELHSQRLSARRPARRP